MSQLEHVKSSNVVTDLSEVGPHLQEWLVFVVQKWLVQQLPVRAGVAPQDHAPYEAPETVSLIRLVTAEEEASASLHEGTVEIPSLETALSHLKGQAEEGAL